MEHDLERTIIYLKAGIAFHQKMAADYQALLEVLTAPHDEQPATAESGDAGDSDLSPL